jgi:hypothetical protein
MKHRGQGEGEGALYRNAHCYGMKYPVFVFAPLGCASRMKPTLGPDNYNVSAQCPTCAVVTSFDQKMAATVNRNYDYKGQTYSRILYVFSQCARCGTGGLAKVPDNGTPQSAVLEQFFPSGGAAPLPNGVPTEIEAEFREAELCAAFGANRAASVLFRSVLEKTLKANGYTKSNDPSLRDLQKRIDAASADGIITDARRKKAHEDIRALGNDVLHDDWRAVSDDEVEDSHRYCQRILEDLYDDRATVEGILITKGKLAGP